MRKSLTSVPSVFNICSLDRNPIRVALQKGESCRLQAPKKPFSSVCGRRSACLRREAGSRVGDVIRVSESHGPGW